MSHSAHTDPEQMKERYDPPEVLAKKIDMLVKMIRQSKHMVCFTGAGISTSAGIPDFRGPQGKWTREAQGLTPLAPKVPVISAFPTKTHMALVELQAQDKLKYLISQNCDGLHVRSGFPQNKISELHGNSNMECCETCGQKYFRDMSCHRKKRSRDHFTGRYCVRPGCSGRLLEYTIDFGQNLPEEPLSRAYENAEKADLHLAMGSSLTVSPACTLPELTRKNSENLVIVNLQNTPLTDMANFQIYAKTDVVMEEVMKRLGYSIPEFRLHRKLLIGYSPQDLQFYCRGADVDDTTLEMDFIHSAVWSEPRLFNGQGMRHAGQNVTTPIPRNTLASKKVQHKMGMSNIEGRVCVMTELVFKGHYREPNIQLKCDFTQVFKKHQRVEWLWHLTYNPYSFQWESACELSNVGESQHEPNSEYGDSHAEYNITGIKKMGKSKAEAKRIWEQHVAANQKRKS